jgi:hypothetical protein
MPKDSLLDVENIKWAARTTMDTIIKDRVQKEVYKCVLMVLGNNELTIDESKEGFDPYPYCQHSTKQFCPVGNRKKHYRGRFREYVVYGNTRFDVYLEVLRLLGNDSSVYYPIYSPNYTKPLEDNDRVRT